ncbi:MAG: hypothetical protein OEM79_03645 [Nitrosopumilus sp.]|nr:hypothetical protein [Nitrosopumilus sp.]
MSSGFKENIQSEMKINYYVIAAITIGILIFIIGNSIEPEVEEELDFYELMTSLGFAAVVIFAFFIARRYWGSKVFGKSYLALALGFVCYNIGWNLWWFYEIWYHVENPYVALPDVFFLAYYPFVIYHLRKNSKYFSPSTTRSQKLIIVLTPIIFSSIYCFFGLAHVSADGGLGTIQISVFSTYDSQFYTEFFTGLVFVFATSLTFALAIVATQIFQKSVLGSAWGLLLLGILLNTVADLYYYINELFGGYVRSDPVTGIWLAGTVFLCYGLYKHHKII